MNKLVSICSEITEISQNALISFNKQHPLFEEHFPNAPTLPGAITVSLILRLSKQYFEQKEMSGYEIYKLERISFYKRILPSEHYLFQCAYQMDEKKDAIKLLFSVLDKDSKKLEFARGLLIYKKGN